MEQKKGVVMQKIAAFFDWDGTLSYDGRTVSPATAEAVRTLRGRGNPVFLCTGRSTGFIPEEAWAVGFDGLVAAAGATVRLGDKLLLRRFIRRRLLSGLWPSSWRTGRSASWKASTACTG